MSSLAKAVALVLAYFFVALGIIGILLPGLPTVPFLLLGAWFAARGSERLHQWLYTHPHIGKLLIDWEQNGAIARPFKWIACIFLMFSLALMYMRIESLWLFWLVAVLFAGLITFIFSRPDAA